MKCGLPPLYSHIAWNPAPTAEKQVLHGSRVLPGPASANSIQPGPSSMLCEMVCLTLQRLDGRVLSRTEDRFGGSHSWNDCSNVAVTAVGLPFYDLNRLLGQILSSLGVGTRVHGHTFDVFKDSPLEKTARETKPSSSTKLTPKLFL